MKYKILLQGSITVLGVVCCFACFAEPAEEVLRGCVAREESLQSGHIEFHYTIKNEQNTVLEEGHAYFEWAPGKRFRLGYPNDEKAPLMVCDGEYCIVEDGTRWTVNFVDTPDALLPDRPSTASHEAIEALQTARIMHHALVMRFLFPITNGLQDSYEWIAGSNRLEIQDRSKETNEILLQLIPKPAVPGDIAANLENLYTINERHIPQRWWVAFGDSEPELNVQWTGKVELAGCGPLPENMQSAGVLFSGEAVFISIALHGDRCSCGPVGDARFHIDQARVVQTFEWPQQKTDFGLMLTVLNWVDDEIFVRVHPVIIGLVLVAAGVVWLVLRVRSRNA